MLLVYRIAKMATRKNIVGYSKCFIQRYTYKPSCGVRPISGGLYCSMRTSVPLDLRVYLARRKSEKIFRVLMLIRCLSCETREIFVSLVVRILTKVRLLRLVRLELSLETGFVRLITRRSQVQILPPQPENR